MPITPFEAFRDSSGHVFHSREDALGSELATAIGKIGNGDSLTPGIAKTLIDKRADIIALLMAIDDMSVFNELIANGLPSEQIRDEAATAWSEAA